MGKIKTLAMLTVGFIGGYVTKDYQKNTAEYFNIQANKISYQNTMHRPISVQRNAIVVGTLKERLEDLLYENPYLIKRTVEEIYGELKPIREQNRTREYDEQNGTSNTQQVPSDYHKNQTQQNQYEKPQSLWERAKKNIGAYFQ
jgi:hypothetical protein